MLALHYSLHVRGIWSNYIVNKASFNLQKRNYQMCVSQCLGVTSQWLDTNQMEHVGHFGGFVFNSKVYYCILSV